MREITDQAELKEVLLDALVHFADFCDANDLRYYLCGGTLLGAIRHRGFIPWDDDIDVIMPRPDYERFMEITKGGMTDRYSAQSHTHNPKHVYPFIKVYDRKTVLIEDRYATTADSGVFIDVFPLDGIPESDSLFRKRLARIKFWRKIDTYAGTSTIASKNALRTVTRAVLVGLGKTIGTRFINGKIDRIARACSLESSKFCGVLVWGYGAREKMVSSTFLPRTRVVFEGHEFYTTNGYDEYLRGLYGDYMTLPPEEKRVSHHDFRAYWKD